MYALLSNFMFMVIYVYVSGKRKIEKESLISEAIIKSREIAEKNKERRHQENIEQRTKFLAALDAIQKKL